MTYKLADYSDAVTVNDLDAELRANAFDGVFHYVHGNDALRIESVAVVGGIRAKGWQQGGIDVPTIAGLDPHGMVAAMEAYGFLAGSVAVLDLEPAEFDLHPAAWVTAADFWQRVVRAGGYSPWGYGVDRTCAACFTNFDVIWRAIPGQCDPNTGGLNPAFFAGRRAVQCSVIKTAVVEFDVSYSQIPLKVDMLTEGMKLGLAQVAIKASYGRFAKEQEEFDFANALADDGSNFNTLCDELRVNAGNPDGVRLQNTTLADEVDVLKATGTVPSHTHDVTVSGTSGAPK